MDVPFRPTLYANDICPFCMKVRLFLLEAGVLDKIVVRSFSPGSDDEKEIRSVLAPHFDKLSFPVAEIKSGHFVKDSDEIIAQFKVANGITINGFPTLSAYQNVLDQCVALFRENLEMKKKLVESASVSP